MNSFNNTNLQHIREIFTQKTGVPLTKRKMRKFYPKPALLCAVALLCTFSLCAFTMNIFSPLAGDDLSFDANYQGHGIIQINITNHSDKNLNFEPTLKLMRWSDSHEIEKISNDIVFQNTKFAPHTTATMIIDISKAYDVNLLEEPLNSSDYYYLVLTNNNFAFGQDWMCTVDFAESFTGNDDPKLPTPDDSQLMPDIEPELLSYFSNIATDITERQTNIESYLKKCNELLNTLDKPVICSTKAPLTISKPTEEIIFDDTVLVNRQQQLIGLHQRTLDNNGLPIGSTISESALVISSYIPQHKGESDGGADLPLVYLMSYNVADTLEQANYVFIHGHILTFGDLAPYQVYQDNEYVIYNVTHLFYSDLDAYVKSFLAQRTDIYLMSISKSE